MLYFYIDNKLAIIILDEQLCTYNSCEGTLNSKPIRFKIDLLKKKKKKSTVIYGVVSCSQMLILSARDVPDITGAVFATLNTHNSCLEETNLKSPLFNS